MAQTGKLQRLKSEYVSFALGSKFEINLSLCQDKNLVIVWVECFVLGANYFSLGPIGDICGLKKQRNQKT